MQGTIVAGGGVADKAEMLRVDTESGVPGGYVVVDVPPCTVSTPGGQQPAKRMMTETWDYLTAKDIDDAWQKPIPLWPPARGTLSGRTASTSPQVRKMWCGY